jgi:hypothetical protein
MVDNTKSTGRPKTIVQKKITKIRKYAFFKTVSNFLLQTKIGSRGVHIFPATVFWH